MGSKILAQYMEAKEVLLSIFFPFQTFELSQLKILYNPTLYNPNLSRIKNLGIEINLKDMVKVNSKIITSILSP